MITSWADSSCRDWDLWGPLLLCLCLGIMLSINVHISQLSALLSRFLTHFRLGTTRAIAQHFYKYHRYLFARCFGCYCPSKG